MSEYAWAVAGMVHRVLACIGKLRVAPATRLGAPKGAGKLNAARVSITRHGVIATNINVLGAVVDEAAAAIWAGAERSAADGCQYSGAGQYFRGATSLTSWALSASGKAKTGNMDRRLKRTAFLLEWVVITT